MFLNAPVFVRHIIRPSQDFLKIIARGPHLTSKNNRGFSHSCSRKYWMSGCDWYPELNICVRVLIMHVLYLQPALFRLTLLITD